MIKINIILCFNIFYLKTNMKFLICLTILVSVHVPKHSREYEKSPTKKLVYEFIIQDLYRNQV